MFLESSKDRLKNTKRSATQLNHKLNCIKLFNYSEYLGGKGIGVISPRLAAGGMDITIE